MTNETVYDNTNRYLYIKYLKNDDLFCLHVIDEINNHNVNTTIFDFKDSNISPTSGLLAMLEKAKINGKVSINAEKNILEAIDTSKPGIIEHILETEGD